MQPAFDAPFRGGSRYPMIAATSPITLEPLISATELRSRLGCTQAELLKFAKLADAPGLRPGRERLWRILEAQRIEEIARTAWVDQEAAAHRLRVKKRAVARRRRARLI